VEYPFAYGAFGWVPFSSNDLKFNGYNSTSLTISEPTESARTFHGVSALAAIKADRKPDHQVSDLLFAARAAFVHFMRAFTVAGKRLGRTLDEVLVRMEGLGAGGGK